jgi:hypothetical protein
MILEQLGHSESWIALLLYDNSLEGLSKLVRQFASFRQVLQDFPYPTKMLVTSSNY